MATHLSRLPGSVRLLELGSMSSALIRIAALLTATVSLCVQPCLAGKMLIRQNGGFGYSANAPEELLGFSLFVLRPHGLGSYIDFKFSIPMIEESDSYYENISVGMAEGWNDRRVREQSSWTSINLAGTYVVSSYAAVYLGLGYAGSSKFLEYYDRLHILGDGGHYWIDGGEEEDGLNLLGGMLVQAGDRWGIQLGAESLPRGLTFGCFWMP